ncbi:MULTISPECIES: alpha/beta hydrolase [unclassified Streptomyces]|uniref:alpha/beta hydrolase n=1 Tax=unclassified Streptomyces TaxID=2593676 RepID=UPI00336A1326
MASSFVHDAAGVSRRTVTTSALPAALLAGGGGLARARAAAAATVRLPAPTGPHPVGVTTLYLVDRSRRDPWEPGIPVREVMATVRYPARTVRGYPLAPQLSQGVAELFAVIAPATHPGLPRAGVDWAATMTHAHPGAPARPAPHPVLLYSPGGGDPRGLGTVVAEELASHGCVVVTVDHPGDACAVEFPCAMTGRDMVRPTVFRGDPRTGPATFRTMIATRIADLRFVLDQVEAVASGRNPDAARRPLPEGIGRALDLSRVGVYGHSAGGTAAAEALYEDRRIAAAVNLEGYLNHPAEAPGREGELFPVARYGVDRPLLLLDTDGFGARDEDMRRSWSAALAHPGGHIGRRRLGDAAHWVFTDYAAVAPQLQTAGLMTAEARGALVGAVDPARSVPAVRGLVRGFFARRLPAR